MFALRGDASTHTEIEVVNVGRLVLVVQQLKTGKKIVPLSLSLSTCAFIMRAMHRGIQMREGLHNILHILHNVCTGS